MPVFLGGDLKIFFFLGAMAAQLGEFARMDCMEVSAALHSLWVWTDAVNPRREGVRLVCLHPQASVLCVGLGPGLRQTWVLVSLELLGSPGKFRNLGSSPVK